MSVDLFADHAFDCGHQANPFRFCTFSRGSRQTVLPCAHRATTVSLWEFCEQEGDPAAHPILPPREGLINSKLQALTSSNSLCFEGRFIKIGNYSDLP